MDKLLKLLNDISALVVVAMVLGTITWLGFQVYWGFIAPAPVAELVGEWQYWVEPGDTLSGLAVKHYPGRDWREVVWEIEQLNPGIDPGRLQIGQKIVFPEVE